MRIGAHTLLATTSQLVSAQTLDRMASPDGLIGRNRHLGKAHWRQEWRDN